MKSAKTRSRAESKNKTKKKRSSENRFLWPDVGKRLLKIRELTVDKHGESYGGRRQEEFALDHGFTKGSWNHWENGMSLPWTQAVKVKAVLPGLTLDWIYLGDPRGLPVSLEAALRDWAEDGVS
jgi:hypothetical protein